MHSDHRRRYHLRPLAEVHPGDRVSLDADAIAALDDDRPDDVDWDRVHADASQVLDRTRLTPTRLVLDVRNPRGRRGIEGDDLARLLLAKSENPF